jgi:hypothetical protein
LKTQGYFGIFGGRFQAKNSAGVARGSQPELTPKIGADELGRDLWHYCVPKPSECADAVFDAFRERMAETRSAQSIHIAGKPIIHAEKYGLSAGRGAARFPVEAGNEVMGGPERAA